jgi:hypothetical protein
VSVADYQQLLEATWEWIERDANTWLRAMGNLTSVLRDHDLESEDTLKFALRFSAFSIVAAMLVDFPVKQLFLSQGFSVTNYVAVFILYYIVTFIFTVSMKLMGIMLRANRTTRVCFVFALFSTVYWPLVNLSDYVFMSDKELYTHVIMQGDLTSFPKDKLGLFILGSIIALPAYIFIFVKLVSACKYVFGLGLARASLMVMGVATLESVVQITLLRPIFDALIKSEFG